MTTPKETKDNKKKREGRPRNCRVEVWLTPEELQEIIERSEQAGLSRSAYLRTAGLNQPIKSIVDLGAVTDLAKVNGDLGRVAGLLKLWLAEKKGQGAKPTDVEAMMKEFRVLQGRVLEIMVKVIR